MLNSRARWIDIAGVEIESLSIITYVHVHGISDFTVAKRPNIFPAKTFAKCCHQSAAIGLRIKPRACGRDRHVPGVGLGAETPPEGASSVVEPH